MQTHGRLVYLAVVRHGEPDFDRERSVLSESGIAQMDWIGHTLYQLTKLCGPDVIVIHSDARRAKLSAEALAKRLQQPVIQVSQLLYSDDDSLSRLAEILELVNSHANYGMVVLVTHLEYTRDFPSYYGECQLQTSWAQQRVTYGQGFFINCQARTIQKIP